MPRLSQMLTSVNKFSYHIHENRNQYRCRPRNLPFFPTNVNQKSHKIRKSLFTRETPCLQGNSEKNYSWGVPRANVFRIFLIIWYLSIISLNTYINNMNNSKGRHSLGKCGVSNDLKRICGPSQKRNWPMYTLA